MTNMTKKELAAVTRGRYRLAAKAVKTFMLNEFCGNTGYNRKYAIRLFNHEPRTKEVRKGRARKYPTRLFADLIIPIWELLDYPCGTRLQPELINMAEAMARSGEIKINEEIRGQLETISSKTPDRRLKKEIAIRKLNRSRGMTRHGTLLKSAIPIRLTEWNRQELGFGEMDTVAHNGGDPSGEFINWHLVRYCEKNNLFFTRSRPYMKNDNAYVEQKNNTHIRKLLGYERFDNHTQLGLINDLYRHERRLFSNFFRPVMKIACKEKANNSLCHKIYDRAKTPYHRIMGSDQVSEEQKGRLQELYLSLNPVQLKRAIDEKVKIIRKLGGASIVTK